MTMKHIRKTYGVPCRRGVKIRAWFGSVEEGFRLFSGFTKITSATEDLVFGGVGHHPTNRIEYVDEDGYRIWPVTDEQIVQAGFPLTFSLFSPVRHPNT